MSSDIAIRVEGLGKRYRIGARQQGYKTLRERINDAAIAPFRTVSSLVRRNGDGNLTQGFRSLTSDSGNSQLSHIWALKEVSLEVKRGEVIGVIGHNGAGKSTLLKVLSRITEPTLGEVDIYGRVGSLLEVGTGFHPELTGRENIFLNGAILGIKRHELEHKLDEIVAFAEIEQFLDTPVKRYSSGMYLRLAFAVAAHLETETLLVDEVLAVGDAAFQKKCLRKMGSVAKEGRTVVLVSHNMGAIARLCESAVWIHGGHIVKTGKSNTVISDYLAELTMSEAVWTRKEVASGTKAHLSSIHLGTSNGEKISAVELSQPFAIHLSYEINEPITGCTAALRLKNAEGTSILVSSERDSTQWESMKRPTGTYYSHCHFPSNLLRPGVYYINMGLFREGIEVFDYHENIISFEVLPQGSPACDGREGLVAPILAWDVDIPVSQNQD